MLRSGLGWLFVLALTATSGVAAAAPARWGICPLDRASTASLPELDLDRSLRDQAPSWPGVALVSRLAAICPTDAGQIAAMAKKAGLDHVALIGLQSGIGGVTVHLTTVDVASAHASASSVTLKAGANVADGVIAAVCSKVEGKACTGTLHVDGPAHGQVFVDGQVAGQTPFSGVLTIGSHQVVAMLGGRLSEEQPVTILMGKDVSLTADAKTNRLLPKVNDFDVLPAFALPDDSATTKPPTATPPPAATPPVAQISPATTKTVPAAVAPPVTSVPTTLASTPPNPPVKPPPPVKPAPQPVPAAPVASTSGHPRLLATPPPVAAMPASAPPPAAPPNQSGTLVVTLPAGFAAGPAQAPTPHIPPATKTSAASPTPVAALPAPAVPAPVATTHRSGHPRIAATLPPLQVQKTPPVQATPKASPTLVATKQPPASTKTPPAKIETLPAVHTTPRAWMRPTFLLAAGLTGALLITGTVSGIIAQTTANDLNTKFTNRTLTLADKTEYSNVHTTATLANVAFGLSAATAVTAGLLFYFNHSVIHGSGGDAPQIAISPLGAGVTGTF